MAWKNLFDKKESEETIERIHKLTPETQPNWGKMNVSQMLAHCNVAYETTFTDKYPKPKGFKKFLIKLFAKKAVVGPKPYKRNGPTSPIFVISNERDFEKEKERLIGYIQKTQELGADYFDGKESHAFGPLTKSEWNVLFSKHLDHHLQQFGV
ncbi:DUF1569 domain-containing protein [Maribacter cobaltidurans]|uniref:Uncharacterized protein n=1 Tax=Maribacter cobaltidurans TaxID=1178778 RepID=A0A223V1T2_9FLAO|nr:DUF1569 domain-containing protein [Maribacter cobaltidurans]ASV29070.1 hypothetical protein CJ263_01860 [Maribacter cobaltidurans]GGD72164.1 hypothetical protein GCM10011412_07240 [Maribacter cobaltidurans]